MSKFHPKHWTIVCWFLFIVWTWFSLQANYPGKQDAPTPERFGSGNGEVSAIGYLNGWPIAYRKTEFTLGKQTPTVSFSYLLAFLNIPIVLTTLFCLVLASQTLMRTFSIRSLFLLALVLALAYYLPISLGSSLLAKLAYLLPIWISIGILIHATFADKNAVPCDDDVPVYHA